MTRFLTLLLCVLLAAPGCAMHQTRRAQTPAQAQLDDTRRAALGAFASQLPIGSQVRATVTGNHVVRGTLLKRTDQTLLIQTRARVAEPLVEVPIDDLLALEPDRSSNGTARAVAIGAGVGVGAAVGTLLIIAALLGGS